MVMKTLTLQRYRRINRIVPVVEVVAREGKTFQFFTRFRGCWAIRHIRYLLP